jgi:4-carboxymuconolactone decarboxylase
MARIPYVDPTTSSEHVQRALDRLPPMNIFRLLAQADSAFVPYLRFGQAILADMDLDPVLRELAILLVARRTQAQYEWIQHEVIAQQVGATDAQIAAVERDELDAEELGAGARAVLAFTAQAIEQPRPDDATFAALAAVLSPREIVELLLAVGSYQMLAHAMTALDIDLDPPLGRQVVEGALESQRRRAASG